MPEIRFQIQWPDGSQEMGYSPSLVIKDYLTPGIDYDLNDFLERSHTALQIASDRVQAKYGFPCGRAMGQLAQIQHRASHFSNTPQAKVRILSYLE